MHFNVTFLRISIGSHFPLNLSGAPHLKLPCALPTSCSRWPAASTSPTIRRRRDENSSSIVEFIRKRNVRVFLSFDCLRRRSATRYKRGRAKQPFLPFRRSALDYLVIFFPINLLYCRWFFCPISKFLWVLFASWTFFFSESWSIGAA